jgi:hypothetical protein
MCVTINIAIAVSEGLVMAADSLSQISHRDTVHSLHQSVEKITEIRARPIAVMINGLGEIEKRTIISLIREFEFENYHIPGAPIRTWSVSSLASNLLAFLAPRYNAAFPFVPGVGSDERPELGVIVGGYSPAKFFPEVYLVDFPAGVVQTIIPTDAGLPRGEELIKYWGHDGALERIYRGYDAAAIRDGAAILAIRTRAENDGRDFREQPYTADEIAGILASSPDTASDLITELQALPLLRMQHRLRGMPLQEAVEFADYFGQTAVGYDRFCVGSPAVGGDLDVVAIQPDGLHWYRRKRFLKKMAAARERTVELGDREQMRDMLNETFSQFRMHVPPKEILDKLVAAAKEAGFETGTQ